MTQNLQHDTLLNAQVRRDTSFQMARQAAHKSKLLVRVSVQGTLAGKATAGEAALEK